jgi:hypothetical protein
LGAPLLTASQASQFGPCTQQYFDQIEPRRLAIEHVDACEAAPSQKFQPEEGGPSLEAADFEYVDLAISKVDEEFLPDRKIVGGVVGGEFLRACSFGSPDEANSFPDRSHG